MYSLTRSSHFGAATMALLLIAGCGGGVDGPSRHHISGFITHNGLPVEYGTISFNPTDGVSPSGYATIEFGIYNTALNGKGHTGGAHKLLVTAAPADGIEAGWTQPFEPYETAADLPKETSTMDFDVAGSQESP